MPGCVRGGNALSLPRPAALARALLMALAAMLGCAGAASAETANVKIMMDWIIQGTHAPFFVAQSRGYFKAAGVTVDALDSGKGATNVAVSVAGGVYQFGWVDLPSMIRFNVQNPGAPLIAVYMSFDASPLAVITRKDAGIRGTGDLAGKTLAVGSRDSTQARILPLHFLKEAGCELSRVFRCSRQMLTFLLSAWPTIFLKPLTQLAAPSSRLIVPLLGSPASCH